MIQEFLEYIAYKENQLNKNLFWQCYHDFLDLIYPRYCPICKKLLKSNESAICIDCILQIPEYCEFIQHGKDRLEGSVYINHFFSLFTYHKDASSTNKIIHSLKFNRNYAIGFQLGRMAARKFHWNYKDFDWIIPVPISKKRLFERGYNQCISIAYGIKEITNIPIHKNCLLRRNTSIAQSKKNKYDRFSFQKNSIRANIKEKQNIAGKKILLIDDVLTTGTTLINTCDALSFLQPKEISIFTLSVASNI